MKLKKKDVGSINKTKNFDKVHFAPGHIRPQPTTG